MCKKTHLTESCALQAELEAAIVTEWNPMRVGFVGQRDDLWVDDVLNIGVDPR